MSPTAGGSPRSTSRSRPRSALTADTPPAARGRRRVLEPRRRRRVQGRGVARPTSASCPGSAGAGEHPSMTARRVPRGATRCSGATRAIDRGARQARRHRHGSGAVRHLGLRRRARARALPGPADRLGRRLAPRFADGQPVRQHARRAAPDHRPQHDGAARARGPRPGSARRRSWASTRPQLVPGLQLRDDVKPLEIDPARRALVHAATATSCAGRSGRCGSASTTARAS